MITYGMAKCSVCGCDVAYFGRHLFGMLKGDKLYCCGCDIDAHVSIEKVCSCSPKSLTPQ